VRALLTGAAGQLGRCLRATAPPGCEIVARDRAALDVGDPAAVERHIAATAPDLVLNAAAYTAVDRAESEPERAFAINAAAVECLARASRRAGARLLHVSTDFVFDGARGRPYRPDDPVSPLGVYGRSKLEGERLALAAAPGGCAIVRTAWLYSRHGSNFVTRMLELMAERDSLRVVDDQIGSPTSASGLARALWRLAERRELTGLFHWTDAGVASRYDFAVAIRDEALALGLLRRALPVTPVPASEFPTPAPRPAFGVLDKSSTWRALDLAPRHWRSALAEMLAELADGRGDDD